MKTVLVLTREDVIKDLLKKEIEEVIFAVEGYSRFPLFSKEEAITLAKDCHQEGIHPFLEWDILMTESIFDKTVFEMSLDFLNLFSAIRVQDLGALHFLKKNYPQKKVQLILEHGNHNFESLLAFSQVHPLLERMILSPQIPGALLKQYAEKLPCPIEILLKGPVLLSYTPRHLLSRLGENDVKMTCLEGQAFTLHALEKKAGTLIYHDRLFSLEKRKDELREWKNCFFRIDQRLTNQEAILTEGFFEKNDSSDVFVHLKNAVIERRDGDYLGEVIDVVKDHFIGISLAHPSRSLKVGDWITFQTPEGRIKEQQVTSLFNFLHEDIFEGKNGDIVFTPHRGVVSVRSSAYFKKDENHECL